MAQWGCNVFYLGLHLVQSFPGNLHMICFIYLFLSRRWPNAYLTWCWDCSGYFLPQKTQTWFRTSQPVCRASESLCSSGSRHALQVSQTTKLVSVDTKTLLFLNTTLTIISDLKPFFYSDKLQLSDNDAWSDRISEICVQVEFLL